MDDGIRSQSSQKDERKRLTRPRVRAIVVKKGRSKSLGAQLEMQEKKGGNTLSLEGNESKMSQGRRIKWRGGAAPQQKKEKRGEDGGRPLWWCDAILRGFRSHKRKSPKKKKEKDHVSLQRRAATTENEGMNGIAGKKEIVLLA